MRTYARLAVLAAAIAASAAASAVNITFVSAGTFTQAVSGDATYTESVVFQSHPGLANLSNYVETYVASPTSDIATYTSGGDSLTIAIDTVGAKFGADPLNPSLYSEASSWTYVSGTGAYANLMGHGTYTQNGNYDDDSSATTIKGTLNAVPEPASFAVLGLGAAGLLRRRKRA